MAGDDALVDEEGTHRSPRDQQDYADTTVGPQAAQESEAPPDRFDN